MSFFYQLSALCFRGFFRLFYRYYIHGANNPYPGKAILAANHVSFLDPPLVNAAWPEELHFLARSSLFNHTGMKWLLVHLNAHPVKGTVQDIESMRLICELLKKGKKVVIFPEGERSSTGELQTMKAGIAMLAVRMECPIIPVYLQGTYEAWPRHQKWPKLGTPIHCVFGDPIFPSDSTQLNKKQKQELLMSQVQESLHQLRLWLEAEKKV